MDGDYGTFVNAALLVAADQAPPGRRAAFVGALAWFVSMEDIEALDGAVRNLHTDVMALDPGPVPDPTTDPEGLAAWIELDRWMSAFRWQWVAFTTAWGQWVDDHRVPTSRITATAIKEFEQFQAQYNELLRAFTEKLPGQTQAKKSEQQPVGGAPSGIPSAIKWTSAAVIAVAAVYALTKLSD